MYGLSKKKMPYLYPIDEAIGLLNNEIRLVEWRIKYPEQFKSHFNKQPFSPLYLADKTNLIDIMEIISGLFLSKHIVYKNDKPTFLSDLSKVRLSGNFWLVSFKIRYLCLPLFYETRTTPSCHPSGCAYRQL